MPSNPLLNAAQIADSLATKCQFKGPAHKAPTIFDELDALVEANLAVEVMRNLPDKSPKFTWTMSRIFLRAEKLRASDLRNYCHFIHTLSTVLQEIAMQQQCAIETPPSTKKPLKF